MDWTNICLVRILIEACVNGLSVKPEVAVEAAVTNNILQSDRRVDGRALDEIRQLSADVSIYLVIMALDYSLAARHR